MPAAEHPVRQAATAHRLCWRSGKEQPRRTNHEQSDKRYTDSSHDTSSSAIHAQNVKKPVCTHAVRLLSVCSSQRGTISAKLPDAETRFHRLLLPAVGPCDALEAFLSLARLPVPPLSQRRREGSTGRTRVLQGEWFSRQRRARRCVADRSPTAWRGAFLDRRRRT
jgi:hypothetical protein